MAQRAQVPVCRLEKMLETATMYSAAAPVTMTVEEVVAVTACLLSASVLPTILEDPIKYFVVLKCG